MVTPDRARDQMKFKILWKLYHQGCWGYKHIALRDIPKGLPKGEVKFCLYILNILTKEGLAVKQKRKHGERVYLNRYRYEEIRQFLGQFQE